jgi:hypothetical protein
VIANDESQWSWETEFPRYPEPKYDDNGEILFFPRIIGGNPAFQGEFPAKVSMQTRRGDHFCGGALIGNENKFYNLINNIFD